MRNAAAASRPGTRGSKKGHSAHGRLRGRPRQSMTKLVIDFHQHGADAMRSTIGHLLITLVAAAALAGCSSASAPTWTFPRPPAAPAVAAAPAPPPRPPRTPRRPGRVDIRRRDPRVRPRLQAGSADAWQRPVPSPSRSSTTARRSTTSRSPMARPSAADAGKTATGTVNVPAAGLTFLCSIPGHAAAGMTGRHRGHGRERACPGCRWRRGVDAPPAPRRRDRSGRRSERAQVHALRRDRAGRHARHRPRHRLPDHREGHDRRRRASSSTSGRSAARSRARRSGSTSVTPSAST